MTEHSSVEITGDRVKRWAIQWLVVKCVYDLHRKGICT